MRPAVGFLILCGAATPPRLAAQSSLLTALEGSAPAPVLDPAVGALTKGLSGLWSDPTADPHATGVFFGVQRCTYASVQVVHAGIAFPLGPRWSLTFASTDLGNLFDTSLTNQDPSLSNLRAQAAWGRLDATFAMPRIVTSIGLAVAGDNNVGVFQSSTVARAHLRLFPFNTDRVAIGVQGSRPIGGSAPAGSGGRETIDFAVRQTLGGSSLSVTAAVSRGSLWRFSETRAGYGVAVQLNILSQLDLGAALGRYGTTYGASRGESYQSVTAAVRVATLRFGARYTSTRLGVGSGFALSLGYEPGSVRAGLP